METSLAYILDVMNGEFEELKSIMQDSINEGKGRWYNNVNKYRQELNISWDDFLNLDKKT